MKTNKSVVMILSVASTMLAAVSTYGAITYEVDASATSTLRVASDDGYSGTPTLDGNITTGIVVAGKWNTGHIGNGFISFQLPDIGGATIESVKLTFVFEEDASFAIGLYGMGLNSSFQAAALSDYFGIGGNAFHLQEGTLLSNDIFPGSPAYQSELEIIFDDVSYFQNLYTGYNGTDYLILRTTPMVDEGSVPLDNRGYLLGTGASGPVLTITTVPEPSTYAALLGVLALAGMVVRRHRKVK